jgi:hypothetical protein
MAALSSVTTVTPLTRTVFGNKRVVIADLVIGDLAGGTYPTAGITLTPINFGLREIEFLDIESGSLIYKYDYSTQKLLAYTFQGTPGATKKLIIALDAVPDETIRVTAYGYGLKP